MGLFKKKTQQEPPSADADTKVYYSTPLATPTMASSGCFCSGAMVFSTCRFFEVWNR